MYKKINMIKKIGFTLFLLSTANLFAQKSIQLFDGKTFKGLEGDTITTWRIENGNLIGGNLSQTIPHNEFISTTESYDNFRLRLRFKLTGTDGFINSGVQFHSQRIKDPSYEMIGYQADLGDYFWGCLYDESRRKKVIAHADTMLIKKVLHPNEWNDYEVVCINGHIRIWLNGEKTVDYIEPDPTIPQSGKIAFQIHGGGKAEITLKNIMLTPLPSSN
ncbi:MAG: DUF1080 domain-containing protein [Chitinophagaceae bacterium]|nr:DUF1080 domain-containing protein [Chitinophagaceae bacterium]